MPAVRTDGWRAVGVRSRDFLISLNGWIYLPMVLRWRALHSRQSSAITSSIFQSIICVIRERGNKAPGHEGLRAWTMECHVLIESFIQG